MSNFQIGSKVRVPRLNWHDAEIVKVKPFWDETATLETPPGAPLASDDLGTMYLVKDAASDQMRWCISGELILKSTPPEPRDDA